MSEQRAKLVLVTRSDLPAGAQAVQAIHAMRAFQAAHPELEQEWFRSSNTLALLAVPDESALGELLERAEDRGLRFASFHEEDLGGQLTAAAFEPTQRSRRLCRALPKALSA